MDECPIVDKSDLEAAQILIVEDSATQRLLLRNVLEKKDFKVIDKKNGEEALDWLQSHRPDLIVSDIMMPEMNGFDLCKAIKQDKDLKDIPVILVTALESLAEIGKGLEAGVDNFLYKPYDAEVLISRIRFLLINKKNGKEGKQAVNKIVLDGKDYSINTDHRQIIELLVSSFEDTVKMNQQLKKRQTELEEAKKEAELINFKKSKFLATISHEIRTPMMGVLGLLELLNLSKLDTDQKNTLETILDSGKSLLRIIDDILDFSKIEAGKMKVIISPASVSELMKKLYYLYSGEASRKGLVLNTYVDPEISPVLLFDSLRLRQILGNFLSNAIKFTSEGSIEMQVESLWKKEGLERLRFSVKDSGIGIPKEKQEKLFQPFSKLDENLTYEHGGTGLGLAVSRQLAEMMKGSIEMDSQPNNGTTVSLVIDLPIVDAKDIVKLDPGISWNINSDQLVARRTTPTIDAAEADNTLILVVDDHPVNRKVLIRQLNTIGYAALSAENGKEALSLLKSRKLSLMITDCNMPEMTGYELVKKIRQLEEKEQKVEHLPIIACTANANKEARINCLTSGMDEVLVKPIELVDLMHHVDRWLPVSESTPVDSSYLVELIGDDEKVIHEVMMDFKESFEQDLAVLNKAVEQKQMQQIIEYAHRIKGACQVVGAKALAMVSRKIEEAGRRGDEKEMYQYLKHFEEEALKLTTYLHSLKACVKDEE